MQKFSASPPEMFFSFWKNRQLIQSLVHREVVGRYKGSVLGIFWSLINPIFMLAVYTFVFSVVFKARWNSGSDSRAEFALVLFAGLLVFNLFSECVNRSPGLILGNVNYVKRVVFPLEVLPWVTMGAALFHFLISLCVWLVAYLFFIGIPPWTILFLPFVLIPFVFFVMGLSWALASLGVYLRDSGQIVGMLIMVLMFLSPIFFPVSSLPPRFQSLMYLNPMTQPIEMVRDVMYWGQIPSIGRWSLMVVVSAGMCFLGFAWFQKTRKGFADVL
jgi:lipopolysaccharide transport system permease protein